MLWLIAAAYGISTVYATISSIGYSTKIVEIETQTQEIIVENEKMSKDIFESSSLTGTYEQADQLGFASPTSTVYADQIGIASNIQ